MRKRSCWFATLPALLLGAALTACSGGQAGSATDRGAFRVTLVSNGFSPQIYPYRIRVADANGNPTSEVLNISNMDDLRDNLTANNDVLPIGTWPTAALLPNNNAGNQFLQISFNNPIDQDSVLSNLLANLNSNSGLTGNLQILRYEFDSANETSEMVRGRAFVGGGSYFSAGGSTLVWYQCFVRVDANTVAINPDLPVEILNQLSNPADRSEVYFPTGFTNASDLIDPRAFVFLPDTDNNLSTFETFPTVANGYLVRIVVSGTVRDVNGKSLSTNVCTATTVGADTVNPGVIGQNRLQGGGQLEITPGNGDSGVDPDTAIIVSFSKPVQPRDIGEFISSTNLTPAYRSVTINYDIQGNTWRTLYWAEPASVGDFCNYRVVPSYTLPGNQLITVQVEDTIRGLNLATPAASVSTLFTTGTGPGIVNAPVVPEAIYVGCRGSQPGVAVIDLNGFGQGTGDINVTNFPNNHNIGANAVFPALAPGTTNVDAGGAGALTTVRDSTGENMLLARPPVVGQVGDMAIGNPLDMIYNNENVNIHSTRANQISPSLAVNVFGNTVQIAPHPNPPKFLFPPPNAARAIFCEEPTVTSSSGAQTVPPMTGGPLAGCAFSPPNLLGKGDPLTAKDGIFDASYPGIFFGPQPAPAGSQQPVVFFCPYTSRQQIGHFLYVIDRDNRRIVILNSNRFTVLGNILLTDPYAMALAPNLKLLAVSNFSSGKVSFIDVDPISPNFHTVVSTTSVGDGPSGLAWQPQGEDLMVCNSVSNSVSIIAGTTLQVRKTISVNRPVQAAVGDRQGTFGFASGVYFAYFLSASGAVSIFESGPDGVNGIGFDDIIGTPDEGRFRNARAMQPDVLSLNSAVWVCHQDNSGFGQVSHLELVDSPFGPIPVTPQSGGIILPPTFRQRQWAVNGRIGGLDPTTPQKDLLSGNSPSDICTDELSNIGSFPPLPSTQVSNLTYPAHSSKDLVRPVPGGVALAVNPRFLFVANPDAGKVDVFQIDSGKRVRSISVPGAFVLANYWRQ